MHCAYRLGRYVKAGLPLRADRVRRELSAEVSALRHSANKPIVVRWPDFGQKKARPAAARANKRAFSEGRLTIVSAKLTHIAPM